MAPVLSIPLLRPQSDRRLVALAGDGHDRAFEAIVERYRRLLQRYLRRLLSEALAEDVLQATFVRGGQGPAAGPGRREPPPVVLPHPPHQGANPAAGGRLAPAG